jgi:DNA (cytosine-5)-methyltransferase 1
VNFAGLFSGIGGLELGFESAGFEPTVLAEVDPSCIAILSKRFPHIRNVGDVRAIERLPNVDVIVGGFPCQPYSQVGPMAGLSVGHTLIREIFRLVDAASTPPKYIVLENVPNIIHLDSGAALRRIINGLERRKYRWAYRIIDAAAFGRPQRRRRWILIASLDADPAPMLLGPDSVVRAESRVGASGFYWTEGNRGVGWAQNAIPPLKGGSSFGIPGPPAIWNHSERSISVPDIRDAERLQGFRAGWTSLSNHSRGQDRERWKMVGNAVSVPLARWLAKRILLRQEIAVSGERLAKTAKLPTAAFFDGDRRFAVAVGTHPVHESMEPILSFLNFDPLPLSLRATRGFRERYERSPLRKNVAFIDALRNHERLAK